MKTAIITLALAFCVSLGFNIAQMNHECPQCEPIEPFDKFELGVAEIETDRIFTDDIYVKVYYRQDTGWIYFNAETHETGMCEDEE